MAVTLVRSPRDLSDFLLPKAPVAVGPGSYPPGEAPPSPPSTTRTGVFAPFGSFQKKVLNANTGDSFYSPGPGAFFLDQAPLPSPRGDTSSFKSLTPRFAQSAYKLETPGPGEYGSCKSTRVGQATFDGQDGARLSASQRAAPLVPVLQLEQSSPSIPPNLHRKTNLPHSGGRAMVTLLDDIPAGSQGVFHTGESNDMPSPGSYKIVSDDGRCATNFHTSRTQRQLLWELSGSLTERRARERADGLTNAGLFATSQLRKPPKHLVKEAQRQSEAAKVPRLPSPLPARAPTDDRDTTDAKSCRSAFVSKVRRIAPTVSASGPIGPGAYLRLSDASKTSTVETDRGPHAPFGSLSPARMPQNRLIEQPYTDPTCVTSSVPVGAYDLVKDASTRTLGPAVTAFVCQRGSIPMSMSRVINPSLVMFLKESTGRPLQAFLTTDERPCLKSTVSPAHQSPAVGDYGTDLNATVGSISARVKEMATVGRFGKFAATNDNRWAFNPANPLNPDPRRTRGPSAPFKYNPKAAAGDTHGSRTPFISRTARFRALDSANPHFFNTSPTPKHVGGEQAAPAPVRAQGIEGRKSLCSFGTTTPRLTVMSKAEDTPAPGTYSPAGGRRETSESLMRKVSARRFEWQMSATVPTLAPGSYELGRGFLRTTYNVSLADRVAPERTQSPRSKKGDT
ncbi:unnamed protein product [Vitrella brassicaformis CCMP3155]|uniref:Uncharacterized protein n=1 Tax=Vitrella brassicaformis (strain CCMP3155) TaxID=1169540 RepID=A0A0G4F3T9_VITBC|nr:unnamed protein product [Vitrella brassicaformis CCMP3155]|eukprot:CEM06663.1 unnamed protein product [Vitrella brassicaformis CCMP3155]